MPWKYNGQVISDTTGFRNTDGYMSPKNWVTVWDSTEKAKQHEEHFRVGKGRHDTPKDTSTFS